MKRIVTLVNNHQSHENICHFSHLPGKRSPIIVLATAELFLAKVRVPQVLLKLPWSLLLYLVARRTRPLYLGKTGSIQIELNSIRHLLGVV